MGGGGRPGTSCPFTPSVGLPWSKSKRVNCIQGIVTSASVSRLLNVNVSPTLLVAPSTPGPFKLISPKVPLTYLIRLKVLGLGLALSLAATYGVVVSMYRSMGTPGVPVTRSASVGLVTFPKTAHAHQMHGEAGPTPWDSACQRTHCRRARVILLLTRASWIMGCWQQRIRVLAPPTLTAQVVVQQDRACATGSASVGNPFRERCGSRTRKVQEDLFGIGGQACDVRR